jgi:hypothetical protein
MNKPKKEDDVDLSSNDKLSLYENSEETMLFAQRVMMQGFLVIDTEIKAMHKKSFEKGYLDATDTRKVIDMTRLVSLAYADLSRGFAAIKVAEQRNKNNEFINVEINTPQSEAQLAKMLNELNSIRKDALQVELETTGKNRSDEVDVARKLRTEIRKRLPLGHHR